MVSGRHHRRRTVRRSPRSTTTFDGPDAGPGDAHHPGVTIGVELFEPMSLYATMGRAVKYAVLFIALTFAACFAIEFASGVAMHIVQYGVVGLALALFYLTLLALAEHVVFWLAYLAAAGAIVAMITLYTWATLASLRRAGLVAAVLALLYATLFVILRMEDFALL